MTNKQFIELVINYGTKGSEAVDGYSEAKKSVVAQAWAAFRREEDSWGSKDSDEYCDEAYEAGYSYFEDFIKADWK